MSALQHLWPGAALTRAPTRSFPRRLTDRASATAPRSRSACPRTNRQSGRDLSSLRLFNGPEHATTAHVLTDYSCD